MILVTPCQPDDFSVQDTLFQTAFWGKFKTAQSQEAHYFFVRYTADERPPVQFPLVVFLRSAAAGVRYAYAPKAPSLYVPEEAQGIFLEDLALALKQQLPDDIVCLRFDLPWERTLSSTSIRNELRELRMNFGTATGMLKKAPSDYLCPDTVIINLSYSPEQLLANMRQTTRNAVRRAYKSDVVFSRYTSEEALEGTYPLLKEWHSVYKQTALRKHFYFEEYDYFHQLFSFAERQNALFHRTSNEDSSTVDDKIRTVPMTAVVPPPELFLFTARKDGTVLSGLVLAICAHNAYYLYAGSTLEGRELMPNYGLQWEAMLFARRCGCTRYDMLGISPTDNTAHPMYGLYLFKTGFGGDTKHFSGAWDYVYDDAQYNSVMQCISLFH